MKRAILALTFASGINASASAALSQTPERSDPVIRRIWAEGMEKSQLYPMAQALLDSIGPRLTGSQEQQRAIDWASAVYRSWGIPVRAEQYGTWKAWRRGTLHVDLIAPRVHSLEGKMFTWSVGTDGPVQGAAIVSPAVANAAEFEAWLPQVRGKFLLFGPPEPTCRPDANWKEFATPESFERMQKERAAVRDPWYSGKRTPGLSGDELFRRVESAGVVGIVGPLRDPRWPLGWGTSRIGTASGRLPAVGLSCEDYGLVFRLAERNQSPVLRVNATAQFLGEVPVFNVIAELRGREKPNEYVVLSAHFDSWDAASGATDNGSGTLMMMEAMRILKAVYPNPKRTILAAHWSGEEQRLNGSRAFAADHPEVVTGLQALFNQDNGTGRVVSISMEGFAGAGAFFRRWLSQIPDEITRHISLADPGAPSLWSDHASFICHGAPAFSMNGQAWDYETYTWHTNRDTFDKLVFDDLKNNATLVAMLAYLASEDAQRVSREPRVTPTDPRTGQSTPWPACERPARSWAEYRH
jgi:carboxypeptidase Q